MKKGVDILPCRHHLKCLSCLLQGAVWQCVLDKPAMLAATASADFSACVWDAVSGDEKHKFAQDHIVRSVHFSQDSQRLLTAGSYCALVMCCFASL